MKKLYYLLFVLSITSLSFGQTNVGITGNVDGVYINEIHYDDIDADENEFFEVAGPAGTDLSVYTITLYNGNNSNSYNTFVLSGTIDDEGAGVGAVAIILPSNGMQNGAPDGLALSKSGSTDIQFLTYEGTFTAGDGPASGLLSVDIGVSETNGTPEGYSLEYDETSMTWQISLDDTPNDFLQGTLSTNDFNQKSFSVYPNPTNTGSVNVVSASSSNYGNINVAVFDVLGKQVINTMMANEILDVSSLNTGVYIMKITQGKATSTKKLVIN
jgi:hypothetical protein